MVRNLCVIIVPMSWFLAGKGGSYGTRYWGLVTYERGPQEPLGHFLRKFKRKAFFKKKSKVKFLIFSKNQLKNMFFWPRKRIEKRVTRKFDESLAKVSLKLSVAMKLSVASEFHRKFHWNFRMATESFSETFAKLSSNFRMTLFSMHFLGKKIMFCSCFFSKKWEISPWILSKKRFSLEFSSKDDFFLDLSKRCFLFYWNFFLPEVN